jgi:hypothetical protein
MVKVFFKKGELVEEYSTLREAAKRVKETKGAYILYDKARQVFAIGGDRTFKDTHRLELPLYMTLDGIDPRLKKIMKG